LTTVASAVPLLCHPIATTTPLHGAPPALHACAKYEPSRNTSKLSPEDADGHWCRWARWRVGRWRALAREVAHLTLDRPRILARAAGREAFGGQLGQQAAAKRGSRLGAVRCARGMARRRTRRAPVKLKRSGSTWSCRAAWYISVRMARCANSKPYNSWTTSRGCLLRSGRGCAHWWILTSSRAVSNSQRSW